MTELATKAREPERKISRGQTTTAALAEAPPGTDLGTFTGYLAAFDRDHSGDTISGPAALADTLAEFNAGRIVWLLTDAHSDNASDVVARVFAAVIDGKGLRISGEWMPTGQAQELRAMVRAGAKLGLSIDYFPTVTRPDGMGGRILEKVTVIGGGGHPEADEPARGDPGREVRNPAGAGCDRGGNRRRERGRPGPGAAAADGCGGRRTVVVAGPTGRAERRGRLPAGGVQHGGEGGTGGHTGRAGAAAAGSPGPDRWPTATR
jgi:hypothetical protein